MKKLIIIFIVVLFLIVGINFFFNVKKIRCPVKWYCENLDKEIIASEDAVFSDYGWICDCGKFVKGQDKRHNVILYGLRSIYRLKLRGGGV